MNKGTHALVNTCAKICPHDRLQGHQRDSGRHWCIFFAQHHDFETYKYIKDKVCD